MHRKMLQDRRKPSVRRIILRFLHDSLLSRQVESLLRDDPFFAVSDEEVTLDTAKLSAAVLVAMARADDGDGDGDVDGDGDDGWTRVTGNYMRREVRESGGDIGVGQAELVQWPPYKVQLVPLEFLHFNALDLARSVSFMLGRGGLNDRSQSRGSSSLVSIRQRMREEATEFHRRYPDAVTSEKSAMRVLAEATYRADLEYSLEWEKRLAKMMSKRSGTVDGGERDAHAPLSVRRGASRTPISRVHVHAHDHHDHHDHHNYANTHPQPQLHHQPLSLTPERTAIVAACLLVWPLRSSSPLDYPSLCLALATVSPPPNVSMLNGGDFRAFNKFADGVVLGALQGRMPPESDLESLAHLVKMDSVFKHCEEDCPIVQLDVEMLLHRAINVVEDRKARQPQPDAEEDDEELVETLFPARAANVARALVDELRSRGRRFNTASLMEKLDTALLSVACDTFVPGAAACTHDAHDAYDTSSFVTHMPETKNVANMACACELSSCVSSRVPPVTSCVTGTPDMAESQDTPHAPEMVRHRGVFETASGWSRCEDYVSFSEGGDAQSATDPNWREEEEEDVSRLLHEVGEASAVAAMSEEDVTRQQIIAEHVARGSHVVMSSPDVFVVTDDCRIVCV